MIYDYAKRLFGVITVEQKKNLIKVEGVSAYRLVEDIQKQWNTSRIAGNLFLKVGGSSFTFSAFYLPDVLYIIDTLLDTKHRWSMKSSRRQLLNLKDGLKANTWWKDVDEKAKAPPQPRLDRRMLSKFTMEPLDFHSRYFDDFEFETSIMGKRGNICAGAPGSGKTYMALAVAEMRHADYVFICAPNITMEKPWREAMNAQDLYRRPESYWMAKDGNPYNNERFVIFHYEAIGKALEIARSLPQGKTNVVILDESHYMNEMSSGRTLQFIELCKATQSKDIVWASGTPIKKMGYEVIPFLITTDPLFGEIEEAVFKKIFGREGKTGADILQNRMARVMTVVEKTEFKKEKPTIETLPVKLPNGEKYTLDNIRKDMREFITERFKYYAGIKDIIEHDYQQGIATYESLVGSGLPKNEYAEYKHHIMTLRRARDYRMLGKQMAFCNSFEKNHILTVLPNDQAKKFVAAKSAYKYLPLKIQGECLGQVVGKARENCAADIAIHADILPLINASNSKTVVFSSYINAVDAAEARLTKEKQQPIVLYGKNSKDIASVLDAFTKNPNVNPLVTTFKSLSTGVPLLAASTEVLLDSPFRPYLLEQTISRVDRLGQKQPVFIYILQLDTGTSANISTRSKDILDWAQEQVEAITGVKSAYKTDDTKTGLEDFTEWEVRTGLEALEERGETTRLTRFTDTAGFASLNW